MSDNDAIIRDFCDAWGRGDIEAITAAFADDAVYHNIPMAPIEGAEAIGAVIAGFLGSADMEFITHHQVTSGDVVMNERTDTFTTNGETKSIRVMGVFELRDGKIAAWRDYFDMAEFTG
jgi:limonene-1,2-epoxide hydrolase